MTIETTERTPEEKQQYEEELGICATAFMGLLKENNLPVPGDPDFNEYSQSINFYSFLFSKGFELGILVGKMKKECDGGCSCKEPSSIIVP